MTIKLSVVIPCYNEESRFQKGIDHYISYLKKQDYSWELILINDGSKDKTLELMQSTARNNKNIKVITYRQNHGKGYAITRGVENARGAIILFTDIDHSVPIKTIENFYGYFGKGYQVVIGSRRAEGARIVIRQYPLRELLGRGFTFLVRSIINWEIKDATCGFKVFKKDIAQKIFAKLTIYDWAFDAEILFLCKKLNIKVAQAPVVWSDARGTKVSLGKDVARSFLGLVKIRWNDLREKYD